MEMHLLSYLNSYHHHHQHRTPVKHHWALERSPHLLFFGTQLNVTPSRKPSLTINTLGWRAPPPRPPFTHKHLGFPWSHCRPHANPRIRQSPGLAASSPRPVKVPATLSKWTRPLSESRLHFRARLQSLRRAGRGSQPTRMA